MLASRVLDGKELLCRRNASILQVSTARYKRGATCQCPYKQATVTVQEHEEHKNCPATCGIQEKQRQELKLQFVCLTFTTCMLGNKCEAAFGHMASVACKQ